MPVAKLINQILSYFGVSIIRKSTRDSLLGIQQTAHSPDFNLLLKHQMSTKWDLIDYIDKYQTPISHMVCPLCEYADSVEKFNKLISACIFGGGTLCNGLMK
jgi:hypothetical protein